MKRFCCFLLLGLGVATAGEFLGVVPGANPEDLTARFAVVGYTARGVLVIGGDDALAAFRSMSGIYVDASPRGKTYYRVRLFDPASASELASIGRLVDFDGTSYLLEGSETMAPRLQALGAKLGRVSLKPLVLRPDAPVLPTVLSDPLVQAMVDQVSPDSVLAFVRRLQNYHTRYSTSDSARAAAQWIAGKFRDYGCDSVFVQNWNGSHAPNVVGIKYGTQGTRNPYAIIDGHFDSYQAGNAPGADDNASGTVSAIEACRVLRNYEFVHDMRFIAFSGEEFGLLGSEYYADQARSRGDSILGVFNFDMIGYVDASPEELELITKISNPPCGPFSDFFIACADTYTTLLNRKQMVSDNQNSDHGPFWNNGYLSFCGIEDFWPVNPWYHTTGDSIGAGYNNNAFCTEVIRAGVAALATICEPVPMNIPLVGYFRNRIDDATGNNNQKWDAGESIAVTLTLKNSGLVAAHNVSATVSTTDPYVTLYRTGADYGTVSGQDTALGAPPYLMRAAGNTPREHVVNFTLTIISTESTWTNSFSIGVGEFLVTDPIPDGPRTPALYWAYDDVDAAYPQHPTYSWVEIRGQGTHIPYAQNDEVALIDLPPAFGPLKYYGQRYTQVSVSADGWVAAGNHTTPNYSNTTLPGTSAPPGCICLNWDDLYPDYSGSGYVYYYHDAANHCFIVEYDSVPYYGQTSIRDKFELLIYDTAQAAPNGGNAIVAQYKTAAGFTGSTVGIQDPTQTIGIQDLLNGSLTRGAAPIAAGRAIRYLAQDPSAVVEGPARHESRAGIRLRTTPNPVMGMAVIEFTTAQPGRAEIAVFDAAGRKVSQLFAADLRPGTRTLLWNAQGLASGIYFVRLTVPGAFVNEKAVINTER